MIGKGLTPSGMFNQPLRFMEKYMLNEWPFYPSILHENFVLLKWSYQCEGFKSRTTLKKLHFKLYKILSYKNIPLETFNIFYSSCWIFRIAIRNSPRYEIALTVTVGDRSGQSESAAGPVAASGDRADSKAASPTRTPRALFWLLSWPRVHVSCLLSHVCVLEKWKLTKIFSQIMKKSPKIFILLCDWIRDLPLQHGLIQCGTPSKTQSENFYLCGVKKCFSFTIVLVVEKSF